jgi:membrane protein DedA with SNARE-associated domain
MLILASITSSITGWIAENGVYAVFALMLLDALFPIGGELVMLYAGVLAAGAVTGHGVSLFGATLASGGESYVTLALAGTLGYLLGACVGWELGRRGGRALILRRGRWLHLGEANLARAEAWFERHGRAAVLLGRVTPVVRSFISIPAGILATPLTPYVALTAVGSALWCFGFAAGGWALGGRWKEFHDTFRYADYVGIVLVVALLALVLAHVMRSRAGRDGNQADIDAAHPKSQEAQRSLAAAEAERISERI